MESWKVNCSTSCAAPEAGGLETSMDKTVLEEHPQGKWKQFLVSNASNDTVFYCHFTCSGKQHMESLNISVYRECLCVGLFSPARCAWLLLLQPSAHVRCCCCCCCCSIVRVSAAAAAAAAATQCACPLLLLQHTNCSVTPPGSSQLGTHLPRLLSYKQARPVGSGSASIPGWTP